MVGGMPPEPEGLWRTRLLGQSGDLDEQEGSAHDGPSTARVAPGVLPVGLGVQPLPGAHYAVLCVLNGEVPVWGGPRGRQVADELHAMASRTAGPWLGGWVRVEAPPSPQAHQESGACRTESLRQLDRVVASVEDEPGQGGVSGQVGEEGGDLLGGHRVAVLLGAQSPNTQGSGPTLPRETQLGDPGIGPACDDGLTS